MLKLTVTTIKLAYLSAIYYNQNKTASYLFQLRTFSDIDEKATGSKEKGSLYKGGQRSFD